MPEKKFDIIVFGATSFVGQILAHYLLQTYDVGKEVRWAIAGRSEKKLNELKQQLGQKAQSLYVQVADSTDEVGLKSMCEKSKVIVSTVGPYALYGEALVKICAETGTDYCDLTGEAQWISKMIIHYEATAKKTGARIVHCCGFDSIPSDMGVYFLQKNALAQFGRTCTQINMRVKAVKGELSGGTAASILNIVKEASDNPALRKELANPYSLCGKNHGFMTRQNNIASSQFDRHFNSWVAPFVMAGINTRIVHRSNLLANNSAGNRFKYDEAILTGRGIKGSITSMAISVALAGFMISAAIKPSRWVLEKFVMPKPGEGPSKTAQDHGFYDLRFFGLTEHNEVIMAKVTGDRDPGYGSTAKILGETAVCLAKDISRTNKGGFWTPSTLFGDKLLSRLVKKAGLSFELI